MTTWGESLGKDGVGVGEGVSMPPAPPPEEQSVTFDNFADGLVLADAEEDLPAGASPLMLDMEVSRADRLIRAPGFVQTDDISPRSARWIYEHPSIDNSVELVVIDPPFIGYKGPAGWNWQDLGIAPTGPYGWTVATVAGQAIFSNGFDATYVRDANSATVTDISAQIVARAFGVAFGRVFALVPFVAGASQSLMVKWNASSGLLTDWTGLGSGAEFLLADQAEADRLVAARSLGFDVMGILMRKSLWAAYQTGVYNRPAEFRPRFPGVGCVAESTVASTPEGVTFLSDEGVVSFDVNQAKVISEQINPELLPLDYNRLQFYNAVYLPGQRRYVLSTPSATWVYEFPYQNRKPRWFKRSVQPDTLVVYANQFGLTYWEDLVGSWDDQSLTWEQLVPVAEDAPPQLFVVSGSRIGRQDFAATSNMGVAQNPIWRSKFSSTAETTRQYTTLGVELSYRTGAAARIRILFPDDEQNLTQAIERDLPVTGTKLTKAFIPLVMTGQGVAVQVEVVSGQPEIARIRQVIQDSGPVTVTL